MAFTLPGSATAAVGWSSGGPAVQGLRQAAADRMAGLNSPSNINLDYNGLAPAPGHVPSAWEQAGTEAVTDQISSALGASPDIQRQMHEADARRVQQHEDEYSHEVDLAGGRPGRIAGMEAGIQNQVGATLSEGSAENQFRPMRARLNAQQAAATQANLQMQHVAPAQATAQGVMGAADIRAKGDLAVEQAKQDAMMGLISAYARSTNGQVDPNTLRSLLQIAATARGSQAPPQQ